SPGRWRRWAAGNWSWPLCLYLVDAAIAPPERSQKLITVGVGDGREVVAALVRAKQLYRRSGRGQLIGKGTDVQRDQIHGYASHDRNPPTGDEGETSVAKPTHEPIGVADPHGCNATQPLHQVGRTIANGHTGVNATGLQDFSFKCNDLAHRVGVIWERIQARDRSSRAGHLQVIVG